MKFHKSHYNDLIKLIQDSGNTKDDFHFVKERGRIIAQVRDKNTSFSYFMNDTMTIDEETGNFYRREIWRVGVNNGKEIEVEDWNAVKGHFRSWLSSI